MNLLTNFLKKLALVQMAALAGLYLGG